MRDTCHLSFLFYIRWHQGHCVTGLLEILISGLRIFVFNKTDCVNKVILRRSRSDSESRMNLYFLSSPKNFWLPREIVWGRVSWTSAYIGFRSRCKLSDRNCDPDCNKKSILYQDMITLESFNEEISCIK